MKHVDKQKLRTVSSHVLLCKHMCEGMGFIYNSPRVVEFKIYTTSCHGALRNLI